MLTFVCTKEMFGMKNYTTVRNIHGTSDNPPPSGYADWKDFWEKKKGRYFDTCSAMHCNNDAQVGAHVHKVGGQKWYIVPFCHSCNNKHGSEFSVPIDDLCRGCE